MPVGPDRPARTRQPAAIRRAALLDAATEVLRVRGVEAATVEEITAAAGVSKGSFYLHFPSKDHLLHALRERLGEELAAEVVALDRPTRRRDWPDFTRRFIRRAIEAQVERADLHDLLTAVAHGHDVEGEGDPRNPAERALASVIEAGIAAGAYRVDDTEATVRLLFALVHAAGDWACEAPDALDRIAAAAGDLTLRALEA
jgi:AcrR family transcriptional regulator